MAATTADVGAIRRQVRAAQHARSYPLLVVGALFVNYGAHAFLPKPMDWPYGATLAFILVWFLSKVNETQVGVGIGRADYLVAAGFVFAASNLVQVAPFSDHLHSGSAAGVWVLIVGVALLGIAVARRDLTLTGLSLVVVVGGLLVGLLAHRYGNTYGNGQFVLPTNWAGEVTALLGAALAAIGLGFYVVERRET